MARTGRHPNISQALAIRTASKEKVMTISVAEARRPEAVGRTVTVHGWVRTRRDSKGGFSFLEINDGSCFGNLQVIAEAALPNYESDIKKLPVGASVTV